MFDFSIEDFIKILNNNHIRYSISDYAGYLSVIIKNNNYQLEIFQDEFGYVSDLQKIPYTWGRMGSTSIDDIILDLKNFLNINIIFQLSLF